MSRADMVRWSIGVSLMFIVSCVAAVDAPSAYSTEHFLCGDEHAAEFDALVRDCQNDDLGGGSCKGVASLKASIGQQHGVVDAQLFEATVTRDPSEPGSRGVDARGRSPYYNFNLNLGITTDTLADSDVISESSEVCRGVIRGASRSLTFEARGSSDVQVFRITSCTVKAPDGAYIAFSGDFVRGGSVEACAYVLPQFVQR